MRALIPALKRLVSGIAPGAAAHLEDEAGYFCLSWRVDDNADRELFVEVAGPDIPPPVVRVGVYFRDAADVTRSPQAREAAFQALLEERTSLETLGAFLSFTHGSGTRDDTRFGWSETDLHDWLTSPAENRDLVWHWPLRNGLPAEADLAPPLKAMAPVWLAWNALR